MTDSHSLVRYDAACRAIAEAKAVDEVIEIRAQAEAMRAYARQARNRQMEADAAEIRIRAERRIGELMAAQREAGLLSKGAATKRGGQNPPREKPVTLEEAGIDKDMAKRARMLAAVPESEFNGIVEDLQRRIVVEGDRATSTLLRAGEKALSRRDKEAALAEAIRSEAGRLGGKRYGVILADPPWRFEPYSRETGMDRAADNHYPTMTIEEIKALRIPAADDCALFLWATPPMLLEAIDAMATWGFTYKSHLVWTKDRLGTGYWVRSRHELLLIGTCGKIPAPEPGTQPDSVISAPVAGHSIKPDVFAEFVELLYPTIPKLEMFARRRRLGWDAWGAEADAGAADHGA